MVDCHPSALNKLYQCITLNKLISVLVYKLSHIQSYAITMVLDAEDRIWFQSECQALREGMTREVNKEIAELKRLISAQSAEIASLNRRLNEKDERIQALENKNDALELKNDALEQYGRRYGIRVENVPLPVKEDDDALFVSLQSIFAENGIKIEAKDVARFHRTAKPRDNNGVKVQQCIVKFTHWSVRQQFLGYNKKARQAGRVSRVNNDLTVKRFKLLSQARSAIKTKLFAKGFTEDQILGKNGQSIPEDDNVFAYVTMNSDIIIRARRASHKIFSESDLNNVLATI